jgi:hypothetical protein
VLAAYKTSTKMVPGVPGTNGAMYWNFLTAVRGNLREVGVSS